MQASEQANLDRINLEKQKTELPTPMEPLIVGLIKSFINDADLSSKLRTLYEARTTRFKENTMIRGGGSEGSRVDG
jgi:hypothetical protein